MVGGGVNVVDLDPSVYMPQSRRFNYQELLRLAAGTSDWDCASGVITDLERLRRATPSAMSSSMTSSMMSGARARSGLPDRDLYSLAIVTAVRADEFERALDVVDVMDERDFKATQMAYASLISGFGRRLPLTHARTQRTATRSEADKRTPMHMCACTHVHFLALGHTSTPTLTPYPQTYVSTRL